MFPKEVHQRKSFRKLNQEICPGEFCQGAPLRNFIRRSSKQIDIKFLEQVPPESAFRLFFLRDFLLGISSKSSHRKFFKKFLQYRFFKKFFQRNFLKSYFKKISHEVSPSVLFVVKHRKKLLTELYTKLQKKKYIREIPDL